MSHTEHILVIGLGSTLRGDDALGRIACQRLRAVVDQHRVKVIDHEAPTPELAAEIARVSLVIFVDASVDGPPDEVVARPLAASGRDQTLAHGLDLNSLVELAGRLYERRPESYLISFRGRSFDLSDQQLSDAAEKACDSIVRKTLALIDQSLCTSSPAEAQMQPH